MECEDYKREIAELTEQRNNARDIILNAQTYLWEQDREDEDLDPDRLGEILQGGVA
jgi:hypothetical protein